MRLENVALVLEGGGMRGMFSAGVFEAFMQKNIIFPYISAVSAGACNICSYMSHQPMRTRKIIKYFVNDPRYFGMKNWLKSGSFFGFDFIFNDLPKELLPFDYEAFDNYPGLLEVATTDIVAGKTVWYSAKDFKGDFTPIIASSSMPFLAPIVNYQGLKLLDGALLAPMPIERAMEQGYKKFIVVLTRNEGYKKATSVPQALLKWRYRNYPKLWEIMETRAALYNKQIKLLESLESKGEAILIRPKMPLKVDKLNIDHKKLLELHDHGVECGLEKIKYIKDFACEF